jgi:hypothetical protein
MQNQTCLAYIDGITDTMLHISEFASEQNQPFHAQVYNLWAPCRTVSLSTKQISLIFMRFAEKYPAWLSENAARVVLVAVRNAFPCNPP